MCRATALAVILMLWGIPVWGATLEWKSNTEPNLAGYHVYHCTNLPCTKSSGTATLLVTLGKVTSYEIGIPVITQYYLVTAYDFANTESDPSNIVTYVPAGATPPSLPQ